MTAHVAERGEGRGRVVLRLTGGYPVSERAIEAAIKVAKAFHSEIESLFVADRQIADAAGYGFAREIGPVAALSGKIAIATIERELELSARAALRRVCELAQQADVPVHDRFVRDTPLGALAHACQMAGPWNIVVFAEPFTIDVLARLERVFERVTGMTGILMVGPRARRAGGPVVAVIEDIERLPGMVRTAHRLAAAERQDVILAITARTRSGQNWIEDEVRHASVDLSHLKIVGLGRPGAGTAVAAEMLRQLHPGLVIAEHGGIVVPRSGEHGALAAALECPLLVVR
ncbi:MAG: hypothetical protein KDJ47_00870 [Hyphomicrobiaceae bacterium]|nr:hypothetical protein [Hyphomicrobiaceae bacterium]